MFCFFSIKGHLKSTSNYRAMPRIGYCVNHQNSSCRSSMSNNDIDHRLIISTSDSSRSTNHSDFSPRTLSTIYQSNTDPYLTAIPNDMSNVVSVLFSFPFH